MRSLLRYVTLILLVSCGKGGAVTQHDDPAPITPDSTFPVVTLNTPSEGDVFRSGGVVSVTGNVTDNSLYQGSISITNDVNGSVVKDQYYEIHYIPSYDYSMSCPISVTMSTAFTVTVKFEDHGHNVTTKTAHITVNP